MKILYMLRKTPDNMIREMIIKQGQKNDITIALIQAAAGSETADLPGQVVAVEGSESAETGDTGIKTIGYQDLLNLIFNNDRVLCV